ncbi:hypothetical protein QNO07_12435 [Streptomyces sp. 549]|uniref:hypothetical protein n=1 Tax=Streptomyces sp. 549 TaxID=3049076 RepID=UPI0024C2EB96|nr:hypothetical protein [Streptomyces sp. 549]MDK1474215.1 hypothetical protein [Streptomyces sp. 549]
MAAVASLAAGVVASLVAPTPGGHDDKPAGAAPAPVSLPDLAGVTDSLPTDALPTDSLRSKDALPSMDSLPSTGGLGSAIPRA